MRLKINPYSKKASERFNRQKNRILKAIGNFEIHHIGSTAIPGLGGKGILDILLAFGKC